MGYVCPVCEDPQADGAHLANHLAFTAMLGDDDHEAWLDDHVPDWADSSPDELAPRVTDFAEETEFPQVFEDTTGGAAGSHGDVDSHGHDHGHGPGDDHGHGAGGDHGHGPGHDQGNAGSFDGIDGVDGVSPGGSAAPGDVFGDDGAADVDPDSVLAEARELTRQRRENASNGDPGDTGSDENGDAAGTDESDESAESGQSDETDA